jgi:hypothetical protein
MYEPMSVQVSANLTRRRPNGEHHYEEQTSAPAAVRAIACAKVCGWEEE